MEQKPPAYQEYARDIYMKCASLTLEQRGAVRTLRDYQWIEGPLLNDPVHLAQVLGVPLKQFNKVWPAIARFFPLCPDMIVERLADPELEAMRKALEEFRRQARESGKRGGDTRWGKARVAHTPGIGTLTEPHKGADGSAPASASAVGTTPTTTRVRDKLTPEAQGAFDGMTRALQVPDSLAAECEALVGGMRNVSPVPTWAAVSLALIDLQATGERYSNRRLRTFTNDAMRHLADGLDSRNGARGVRGRPGDKSTPQHFDYEASTTKPVMGR